MPPPSQEPYSPKRSSSVSVPSWAEHWHECLLIDWLSSNLDHGKLAPILSPAVIRAAIEIRRGLSPAILSLLLPQPSSDWELIEFGLQATTRRAFQAAGITSSAHFEGHSIAWLLSKPGITLCHLLEFLRSVEQLPAWQLDKFGSDKFLTDTFSRYAQAITTCPNLKYLTSNDPRFGRLIDAVGPDALPIKRTLIRVAGLSCRGISDSSSATMERLLAGLAAAAKSDSATEFFQICFPHYSRVVDFQKTSRNRRVVAAYYGLRSADHPTLEAVGSRFRITRERVRQLCRIRFSTDSFLPFAPATDRIIRLLENWLPIRVTEGTKRLRRLKLLRKHFTVQGALRIAECLGRQHSVKVQSLRKGDFLVDAGTVPTTDLVRKATQRAVRSAGLARVQNVIDRLQKLSSSDWNVGDVRSQLFEMRNIIWLDSGRNWFALRVPAQRRNPLRTRIHRILAVAKSISVADLRAALRRDPRVSSLPPDTALLRFVRKVCGFNVVGNQVSMDTSSSVSAIFRGDERLVVEVLLARGPVMLLEQLWQESKAKGVGHPSFWRILSASPVFSRVATGIWGLVGAKTIPGEIEDILARRAKRQKALQDHGWTHAGFVWTAYRLSESALNSGVVSIPAAKKAMLDGEFMLIDRHSRECGTLKIKNGACWGLGPYFRSAGLESGDFLVLEFDIARRCASIAAGDEGLLDRYIEGE